MKKIISAMFLVGMVMGADTTKICVLGTSSRSSVGSTLTNFAKQISVPIKTSNLGYNSTFASLLDDTASMKTMMNGTWDYAWLMMSYPADSIGFVSSGKRVIDSVRKAGTVPVLWMRRTGEWSPEWDSLTGTWKRNLQDRSNEKYWQLAEESSTAILPSGEACAYVLREEGISVFHDNTHPTTEAILLNSFMFYSLMLKRAPFSVVPGSDFSKLTAPVVHLLRNVAWNFVMNEKMETSRSLIPVAMATSLADSIRLSGVPATIEIHVSRQVGINIFKGDGSVEYNSNNAIFKSLNPSVAKIDCYGKITATGIGKAKITAWREKCRDTIEVTVIPSTAVLDSITLSPKYPSGYVVEGYKFTALGHFHNSLDTFTANIDNAVSWISDDTTVFVVENGFVMRKSGRGGAFTLRVELDGKADTAYFTMPRSLNVLKRINFQEIDTLFNPFWEYNVGTKFNSSKGFGWIDTTNLSIYWHPDFKSGVELRGEFPLTWTALRAKDISKTSVFKIDVPDGDYIIRLSIGHCVYKTLNYVTFGDDTLAKHTGVSGNIYKAFTDTIQLRGEQGLSLTVYGSIQYMVLISNDGVDMDSIAFDKPSDWTNSSTKSDNSVLKDLSSEGITIHPNPFNPEVMVSSSHGDKISVVAIYDAYGRLVDKIMVDKSETKVVWHALLKPSGMYYFVVDSKSGRHIRRVLKIK